MVSGAILAAGLLLGAALCALHVDLPTGLLLLMILLIFWSDRSRKRAEFTADGTSFSAGTPVQGYIVSAAWVAYALAKAGTPLSGLALTYQPVAAVYSVFAGLYAALAVVFALVAAVMWWRPMILALTPEGVVLRRFVGYRLTPWDALPPDPAAPSRRAIRIITMDVDQRFATDSIEYYRTHPEHRAAIGTPAEHERLSQALLEGQAAAPAPAES
jgi:MFS family permease